MDESSKGLTHCLTTMERGKYAQMCGGYLARPLVSSLCLDGKKQQIEYEGLHQICFKCGQYGH